MSSRTTMAGRPAWGGRRPNTARARANFTRISGGGGGTRHDPDGAATTWPLIREGVRRDMPVLAICRGIQELNVALGGTLHQRIFEMPERFNHRRRKGPMTLDERYGPAHPVALTEGGLLRQLAGG